MKWSASSASCANLTTERLAPTMSCSLGVLFAGVLAIRALLLGIFIRAPESWKLPKSTYVSIELEELHILHTAGSKKLDAG